MGNDAIESVMREQREFSASDEFKKNTYINSKEKYDEMYKKSIDNPESFWAEYAEELHWFKKWDKVLEKDGPFYKWFVGGKTNVCYNCLDRHLEKLGDKKAIIWQGEPEEDVREFTYKELHKEVCKFANALKNLGVKKGDRVCVYLPMLPELPITMLACARIGVIHSVVFGGFSAEALRQRVDDSEAKIVVTSDIVFRNGKKIPQKENVDHALEGCKSVEHVIVVNRCDSDFDMKEGRDLHWEKEISKSSDECACEELDAEDPLFILYTSGTTGKPKGVLHTQGGYLLYVTQTYKWIFDHKESDVYWCTADIGWITGHSYILYGPLSNGATSVMLEGTPLYPEPDRAWKVVEKFKVSVLYTAPTAIRALQKEGDDWVNKHDLSTLRLLGSVGEPINPEAWTWYYKVVGKEKCPIVDTWWQTETGGIMITPLPGAMNMLPGSACRPFFGILPDVYRDDGTKAGVNEGGNLVIKKPWPSMLRTVWKNPDRYKKTYFGMFGDEIYVAGDGAKIDEKGNIWIMGRLDDVVNVSGHRLGTAEIESAIVSFKDAAEAAVVPYPHELKGQALYAFVTLKHGVKETEEMKQEIRKHVAHMVGPIAKPDKVQFTSGLPKTRSGKIMRRILKAIAEGKDDVGNTTTLADESIVDEIKKGRI